MNLLKRRVAQLVTLLIISMLTAPHALAARDVFITALLPCLEQFQDVSVEPRFQIVLDQGWTAALFSIAEKDGGGLGTDLCGELGGGGLAFSGSYVWPQSLGAPKAVTQKLVSPAWLDQAIQNARKKNANRNPVQRISVTALPERDAHLVRVQFVGAEADARLSVDLNAAGAVIARDARVPERFPLKAESDAAPAAPAESIAAPSVDPRQALALLLGATQAKADATVLRLTLSSFSAGLVYRDHASSPTRQTQFNYIDAQADTVTDALFDFPPAFKPCTMTLAQAHAADGKVALQKRYQAIAKRLQHLILECSADRVLIATF